MRLNLGCGERQLDGWVNVDLDRGDVHLDLGVFPWPFEDESATTILASHILEHFDKPTGRRFLAECYRILKWGGVLALAVPDLDIFVDCINEGDWSLVGDYKWRDLNHFMGGDAREGNAHQRHRYMYTRESLAWALAQVGFVPLPYAVEHVTFDSSRAGNVHTEVYRPISLYLDAIKGRQRFVSLS